MEPVASTSTAARKTRWSPRVLLQKIDYSYQNLSPDASPKSNYGKRMERLRKLYGEQYVKNFKKEEAVRAQLRRLQRTPEQVARDRELQKVRTKRYKLKHKDKVDKQQIREYNRQKKRESRARCSDKERLLKRLELEKQAERQTESSDSEVSSDSDTNNIIAQITDLMKSITPKKRKKLRQVGLLTPKSMKQFNVNSKIVDSIKDEEKSLRHKRAKAALSRRRSLMQILVDPFTKER